MNRLPKEEESLMETIQLTSQLEKHLRKLMSSRKQQQRTIGSEGVGEEGVESLQKEIKILREENGELFADNQQICRDLLRMRDENREMKKELAQQRKHISYLQSYNEDLKKELLFWMRKPTKAQSNRQNKVQVGDLMQEVMKLRRENGVRQGELEQLKKTVICKQTISPNNIKCTSLHIQPLIKLKKKQKHSKPHLLSKLQNDCTSCNYLDQSSTKRKKTLGNSIKLSHKRQSSRTLCECHQKYIQTSQFKH